MACNSDYMGPSDLEIKIRHTAKNIAYVKGELGIELEPREREVLERFPLKTEKLRDYLVSNLCSLLTNLNEEQLERIVYNPRSRESRRVANWWEDHQEADRERIEQEKEEERKEELRKSAYSKLSDEEKKALGLK